MTAQEPRDGSTGARAFAFRLRRWQPPKITVPNATAVLSFGLALVLPAFACYVLTAAVAGLIATTAGGGWSAEGALRAAAPFWLAVHQVPLTIGTVGEVGAVGTAGEVGEVGASAGGGAPLGVLPLLPTIGLILLVAGSAARATARLPLRSPAGLAALVGGFAGVHGALGVLVAMLQPVPRIAAAPWQALLGCAGVSGLAAALGWLRAAGFGAVAPVPPAWLAGGVRAGLAGLAGLLTAGALFTFGGLLFSADAMRAVLTTWDGAPGGQLGVTVLSIAYLPNAVVGALSWVVGPGLSVGAVSVTLFGTSTGELPAVPLLAALPEPGPAPWRILVFALPVLAGVLVGRRCRAVPGGPTDRLHAVITAGTVAAAGGFLLAVLAGGRLGGGAFDPVRIPPASLAVAVFGWLVLPACAVVVLAGRTAQGLVGTATADPDSAVSLMIIRTVDGSSAIATSVDTSGDHDGAPATRTAESPA